MRGKKRVSREINEKHQLLIRSSRLSEHKEKNRPPPWHSSRERKLNGGKEQSKTEGGTRGLGD